MQCRISYVGISMVEVERVGGDGNSCHCLPIGEWHKESNPPKVGQIVTIVYDVEKQRYVLE